MAQEISVITNDQIDLIKKTVCIDASEAELALFIQVCQKTGLDPFTRQIYSIKRNLKNSTVRTIQVGIDGLRSIADRTGKYSPGNETSFVYDEKKRLISATAYVKKMTSDGTWHEIGAMALLSEYGVALGLWGKMPHVMLEKVAEARALRRAFPQEMCGLLTDDEMEQANKLPPIEVEAVKEEFTEKDDTEKNEVCISKEQVEYLTSLIAHDDEVTQKKLLNALKKRGYENVYEIRVSEFSTFEKGIKDLIKSK